MAQNDDNHPVRPYHDKLGTMPDGELAKICGTTMWVVRGYRLRAGIPAYDRWAAAKGTPPKTKAPKPKKAKRSRGSKASKAKAASKVVAEIAPAAEAPVAARAATPARRPSKAASSATQWAWKVVDTQGGDRVVVGATVLDVAHALHAAGLDIDRLERVARML